MITISPRAFFFDFDGVIVDSEKIHMLAALEAVQGEGLSFSEEYYFQELLGYDDVGLFSHLWKEQGQKLGRELLGKLLREKNSAFMQLIAAKVIYFDGVIDFIRALEEKNVPLAVVSGALHGEIMACLDKGGLAGHFKFIVSADKVTRSKPDPESYEKAWEDMLAFIPDLKKSECWAIEDSPAGISAATEAGVNVIGITNSVKADQLTRADHVVTHVNEIKLG
jgi:HAD superfamily hydrolase (TIGR01509 family)